MEADTLPCCERQFFDSSRVSCCYFRWSEDTVCNKDVHSSVIRGQGILLRLNSDSNQRNEQLVVLTSHQLFPTLSSVKDRVLGFCDSKKEFPLASYVDQQQLRLITCCGAGECLWDNRQDHPGRCCDMRSDCTVLLLGDALTRDILAEFGTSLCIFSANDVMDLKLGQEILFRDPIVHVYHRTKNTVLSSPFQIKKPPAVDSSLLLSTQIDWYHKNLSMIMYKPVAPLPVIGAPIIYCEPNSGKPWLLGMHVYLESQTMQYGVSIGHMLELLQCKRTISHPLDHRAPHVGHIPKLSLLAQAVYNNICSPCYYDNIRLFFDNFGCKLLLTDLLQISHYIATKQLLFAQSESFYDDVEIRRASLSLLVVISKLFQKFDALHVKATVDGVKEWCPSLTAEEIQKGFSDLCQQLAFCILPDKEREDIAQTWLTCWSNLLCLNGLITGPIFQFEIVQTFRSCQTLYPCNSIVQKSFGEIMVACLAAQFHRVTVVETKQVARDQEMRELRETIVSLQKEVKRHDSVVTSQQQEGQPSELSAGKLHQRVVELERENARLQLKLAESERTKQELLGYMQGRYSSSLEQQLIWNGMFKKQGPFDLGMEYKQRNGDQNNLSNAFIGDPLERDSPPSDNAHRQSEYHPRTQRFSSLPASTPKRPPSLDTSRRAYSASAKERSYYNNSSSSYPSSTSSLDHHEVLEHQMLYEEQQSITSTSSSDGGSIYGTPAANTPEGYNRRFPGVEDVDAGDMEPVYREVVKINLHDFIKHTDFQAISPHFYQNELINSKDFNTLSCHAEKCNLFYMTVLPRKGAGAYKVLRYCIRQETEHRGHTHLNSLFEEAEKRRRGRI